MSQTRPPGKGTPPPARAAPRSLPGAARTGRDPLLDDAWGYIERRCLDDFDTADWHRLNAQREQFRERTLWRHALRLLAITRDDPTFGYQVNNYHHSLQTATMMYRDGLPEEDVVMGLLHDVGFTLCPDAHAAFAENLLGPYLSERNRFILLHHPDFQTHHIHGYPGLDPAARERFRGHRFFDDCADFVERYDVRAIDPDLAVPPLAFFEPMVRRFFERPPGTAG